MSGKVSVHIDYRDHSVDNYPSIYLCEECAESYDDRVSEISALESEESAD